MINEAIHLHQLGQLDLAEKKYRSLLTSLPNNLLLMNNLAAVALQKGNFEEGLHMFNKSLNIAPNQPSTLNNKGNILKHLGRFEEALESYSKAIKYQHNYVIAHFNRGNVLLDLRKPEQALESYKNAIFFNKNALSNNQYQDLDKYINFIYSNIILSKLSICDWEDLDKITAETVAKVNEGKRVSSPFPILSTIDDPEIQRKVSHIYITTQYRQINDSSVIGKYPKHDKIRIGYYSADFRNHATLYLMAGLFEHHDRSKFEITAFSFGPYRDDEMTRRISSYCDRFLDVSADRSEDIVKLSRDLEIDIAIDLKGFTQGMRLDLFAHRLAPIQINYLGYPGTMSASYIDYIIADKILIPQGNEKYYSEKIIHLPNSYQPNDLKRKISDKIYTKSELGLPEKGFIFCSFNQSYKIQPDIFDIWMRVLATVKDSVLWILEDMEIAINNLTNEAAKRGIDANRLIFAKRMPLEEHLARQKLADLFLDTLPCNAHTTCSDALWVGLPIVTLAGKSFASRVSASLLNAIHLPELITDSKEEYEAKIIELATNEQKLKDIKSKLNQNRLTTPLFDIKNYTKHIEKAYQIAYEKYQADDKFDDIIVKEND